MKLRHLVMCAFTLCLLVACTGCHTVVLSYDPGVARVATRSCPVALCLSQEFTNYVHVTPQVPFVADEYDVPFGPALQKYAIYVAQSVFGDVQVVQGQPARSDAKLVLVPRVTSTDIVSVRKYVPVSSGTLGVHWDFNDPKTGKTLFSIRIQCEATHPRVSILDPGITYVVDDLMTEFNF